MQDTNMLWNMMKFQTVSLSVQGIFVYVKESDVKVSDLGSDMFDAWNKF